MKLDSFINGRRDARPGISIQRTMTEVANEAVAETSLFDMDACYETFDKDGYVFVSRPFLSLTLFLQHHSHRYCIFMLFRAAGVTCNSRNYE